MKLNLPTRLKDDRTDCISIILEMTAKEYLDLVTAIYREKGGIKGQREPLKSSSAMRIRKQMVKDIKSGTILPPIVLGLIVNQENFAKLIETPLEEFSQMVQKTTQGNLTIIDGMQRTTALNEAIDDGADKNLTVRIEFWVSTKLNNLIYRMLVLNTGQVPWNLRRQIETVFSSMIIEIKTAVPEMEIYTVDDPNRRSQGGQYHANDLIELYLAFGGRKEKVDTKERLADEFTRLDFIEATENSNFSDYFYQSLRNLALLDIKFSQFQTKEKGTRFSEGKDIFKSQPARVGFITAIAKRIYGRPGFEKTEKEISDSKELVTKNIEVQIKKLSALNPDQLEVFLSLNLLSEKLSVKSSRVGDFEREYFAKAFETFLEMGESIPSMDVCWLSY